MKYFVQDNKVQLHEKIQILPVIAVPYPNTCLEKLKRLRQANTGYHTKLTIHRQSTKGFMLFTIPLTIIAIVIIALVRADQTKVKLQDASLVCQNKYEWNVKSK